MIGVRTCRANVSEIWPFEIPVGCTWVPPHLEDGGKAGERPRAVLDRAVLRLCVLQLQL